MHPHKDYTSYVRGKSINFSLSRINYLLYIQPLSRCSIQNKMGISITERMCEITKEEFCQLKAEWLTVRVKPLRLCTWKMHPIPRVWASFIVQTLEFASNQSEFIVKRCIYLMVILNHEPIDVGLLIAYNIKYMVDAPQRVYGYFCVINELCMLSGVLSHPD